MTTQEIQRLRAAHPFEPFRILVADGRQYDVRHPENFALAGNGRLVAIGMPDYFVTLDLLLVTGIERPIPRQRNGSRRRRT
jgi:hypothetical protein